MGKLNATLLRYLSYEDIGLLAGVELGMRNHELVAAPLAASLSNLQYGGVHKILRELCKHRLLSYERGKKYDGYRLTNLGYDYLALHELTRRNAIASFGNQIGVGKESNIYIVANEEGEELCLKLHRLGRVCFRKVTEKRDYHKHAKSLSWLYLSKISATKEFSYMTALYNEGFPVPKPITFNRHCVIMELVKGDLLNHIMELKDPENLYEQLMDIVVRFASSGLIHGDFNEFNIMVTEEENPIIIDFPQMMSTGHVDAEMYFNRDVECIKTFFRRRFGYESEFYPKFSEIKRTGSLDEQVRCTGFTKEMAKNLNIELGLESEESNEEEETVSEREENDKSIDEEEKFNEGKNEELYSEAKKGLENNIKGRKNNNNDIEKWLSNIHLKDSQEETVGRVESDSDDDCSLDEWISKKLSKSSQQSSSNIKNETYDSSDSFDFDDIRSITSSATINQEDIKKRSKKNLQRQQMKEARRRIRVKGEASAVRRGRKQNLDHVKQSRMLFDL